ncbi:MAG: phage tail sheath family protein [Verrucomicrobia bacterium]|nr:phage tail sheath family protein [Verrucomicrobiota bacterium]
MAATTTVAAAVNILTNQAQAAANAVANAANAAAGVGGATPSSVASAAEAAVGAAGAPGPAALAAATKVAAAARSAVAAAVAPADVATAATNAVAVAVSTVTTQAQTVAAAVTGAANNAATFPGATGNSTAQAAEGSVAPAINSIRAEAQTAANSVQSAAATESGVAGATPASVATAAGAAVAAAGLPGSAALAAAALVASAAQAAVAGATTPGDVATAAANSVATSSTTVATQFQILANTIAQAARTAVTVSANDVATAAENARPAAIAAAASQAAPVTSARLSVNELNLEAANPGAWGNKLRARIDYDVALATDLNLFNLAIEVIRNVSVQPDAVRRLDKVLVKESNLARTFGALPTTRPTNSQPGNNGIVASGGDPFSAAFSSGVNLSGRAVDGRPLVQNDFLPNNARTQKLGLYALEKTDLFNILCLPPYLPSGDVDTALISEAASYCEQRRAFFILDPRSDWNDKDSAKTGVGGLGTVSKNAAVFFPRFKQPNPRRNNQVETFVPCGAVAGIFARTDTNRGVWKAPAGLDANLVGVPELTVSLTDSENGELNPLGVNCLRTMPAVGNVVWGTRTREGDDRRASEWKYIPVRRLALYIEESLYRSTQWVVFEPNDEPLWAQIRLNLGAFMHGLFRQGAFQGQTPRDAYFVKCDKETTTQNDINLGIVNIVVGFAPLKPAEFVIIKIQQIAGQIQT